MHTVGSRSEVYHGNAMHTSGGLKKSNLKRTKDGRIVSRKASAAAKKTMSPCFKAFASLAKKSKGSDFSKMPKKGTKKYKALLKNCKK
jgi:hypothetical protein